MDNAPVTVRDLFARHAGGHIHVLPNRGNCGDGLIYLGFRRLCAEFGVSFTEILYPRPAAGHTLFVLGCGNLCEAYHFMVAETAAYLASFRRIYLLPCTIDPACPDVAGLLETLDRRTTIFCRERTSLELVQAQVAGRCAVHLDEDLAFAFDYAPWKKEGAGALIAFRGDRESLGCPLPPGNRDVSAEGNTDDGEHLLSVVAEYREVYTDRTHIGICAAMLEKDVHFYPNSYFKNRAIYEYSLAGRGNVTFHEFPANLPGKDAQHTADAQRLEPQAQPAIVDR
jgi:hypothetical protein